MILIKSTLKTWNITIYEQVLTGTDQELYFVLQSTDMYAGKWNAA
jgi:hypothetical protein